MDKWLEKEPRIFTFLRVENWNNKPYPVKVKMKILRGFVPNVASLDIWLKLPEA
jgi:hypothetical protein